MEQYADLIDEILEAQRTVGRAFHYGSVSEWLELDLTMPQMKVLVVVMWDGPMPVGQIAESLGISLSTASHLVDRLVQAGFAVRAEDPVDRRRTLVRASERGDALMKRLQEGNRSLFRAWCAQLDPADLAALARGSRALAAAATQSAATPGTNTRAGDLVGAQSAAGE